MSNFKNLRVWIRAKNLARRIYELTGQDPFNKDFSFRDQIRRSAVSIASNIAEGDESGTNKMAVKYFYTAKGSSAELYTQLVIACDIGYIKEDLLNEMLEESEAISAMLHRLISVRLSEKSRPVT
jgi:four helix bundle protein